MRRSAARTRRSAPAPWRTRSGTTNPLPPPHGTRVQLKAGEKCVRRHLGGRMGETHSTVTVVSLSCKTLFASVFRPALPMHLGCFFFLVAKPSTVGFRPPKSGRSLRQIHRYLILDFWCTIFPGNPDALNAGPKGSGTPSGHQKGSDSGTTLVLL